MGNRLLTAAALVVLATCGRPDPVHRGDGGMAHPEDEPDAGSPGGTGGSEGPAGTGGASEPTGGSGGAGGKGGDGTGGAGTGGMGTGGMGTGGAGTGGAGGVGCSGAPEWKAGTYKGGDEVKHGNPAHRYRCKDYPFEGWCGIGAYEPGTGDYWMMAWDDLGACP